MTPILWLLLALSNAAVNGRFSGARGRERFDRLDEKRARGVHDLLVSRSPALLGAGVMAVSALGLVFAVVDARWVAAALWALAALVQASTVDTRRRARAVVVPALEARGLEPLVERDHSDRRQRRETQLGAVTIGAFLLGEVGRFLAARTGAGAWEALGAVATLVAVVALVALLWAGAWVYGDERRGASSR